MSNWYDIEASITLDTTKYVEGSNKAQQYARDTKKVIDSNTKLKMEIDVVNFQNKIKEVKLALKDPNLTKAQQLKLQLQTNDLQRWLTEAKRSLNNYVNTWDAATSRLQTKFNKMGESIWKTFSNIALARWVVIMAIQKVWRFFGDIISSWQEVIRIEKQLNTVLENTWKSAQITSEEIYKMAKEMSKATGVDDDAIVSLDTILLRYKNISWTVLPAVTQAVIDLAFAQSWWLIPTQDQLSDSAQKLWYILNDPIAWYKKLRAIWISFTEDQKTQIETAIKVWDGFKVQWILLDRLKWIYWNASSATDELTKSTALLNVSWDNMKENIGKALIPRIATFVSWINTMWEAIFWLYNQIKSLGWVWWVIKKTWLTVKAVVTNTPLTMAEQAAMQPKLITNTSKGAVAKTPAQLKADEEMQKMGALFEKYWVWWWSWSSANKSLEAQKKLLQDAQKDAQDYVNEIKKIWQEFDDLKEKAKKDFSDIQKEITSLDTTQQTDMAARYVEVTNSLADPNLDATERNKLLQEQSFLMWKTTQAERDQAIATDKLSESEQNYNKYLAEKNVLLEKQAIAKSFSENKDAFGKNLKVNTDANGNTTWSYLDATGKSVDIKDMSNISYAQDLIDSQTKIQTEYLDLQKAQDDKKKLYEQDKVDFTKIQQDATQAFKDELKTRKEAMQVYVNEVLAMQQTIANALAAAKASAASSSTTNNVTTNNNNWWNTTNNVVIHTNNPSTVDRLTGVGH